MVSGLLQISHEHPFQEGYIHPWGVAEHPTANDWLRSTNNHLPCSKAMLFTLQSSLWDQAKARFQLKLHLVLVFCAALARFLTPFLLTVYCQ